MQKLLLFSILVATLVIPLVAARSKSTEKSVKRAVAATIGFCVLYLLGLLFAYPALETKRPGP